jgi:uncharacterized protein YggT (Ycf19 family)
VSPEVYKVVTLLRLVAFMVFVYLALGWLVERRSRRPDSKLKGFFRTLCSPISGPVARFLPPGTAHDRVLAASLGLVALVWLALIVLSSSLRPAG